jgi:DNA-binding NarL/FixJ family response regulator
MEPCRILILEDEAWMREDISRVLAGDGGFLVVASCATGAEAVRYAKGGVEFDAAIVDLGLPDIPGHDVIRALRRARPASPCVAFTVLDDPPGVLAAIRAGARGYLLKSTPIERLVPALREALEGGAPMTPVIARLVLDDIARTPDTADASALTRRERDVLAMLAKGLTYANIAIGLGIGIGTVQGHVKAVYGKLEVASKAEAAVIATKLGLA